MALTSPMIPSPSNSLMSAFSPYSDSPTSPQRFGSPPHRPRSSDLSSHLHAPKDSSPLVMNSPSDIADPSPIATSSNGTDTTDIDDTAASESEGPEPDPDPTPEPSKSAKPGLELETVNAAAEASRPRSDEDEQPSSVIHAPQGFDAFHRLSPPSIRRSTPTPSERSDMIVVSPPEDENVQKITTQRKSASPVSPPSLMTTVPPAREWSTTPRAQTRGEVEMSLEPDHKKTSRSSSRSSNLEDIPEGSDNAADSHQPPSDNTTLFEHTVERLKEQDDEVAALNVALSECWTLCNTLAGLSYVHRERIFSFSGKGDQQEQAWKSCWKLCQKLYETRDEEVATQVRPTLDLCRDFCQCLFEVRQVENDKADSVLRVSFELNNHLYNTHDRNLPEAFRERTLDFYITLCHRLMKQRSELARETDSLLGACWSLAEMLFSLRQNKREGRSADEELLGSAVQACWELCDLFREGWTQIRPDRGTPRPSQTTFTQAFQQAKRSQPNFGASSSASYPQTQYQSSYASQQQQQEQERPQQRQQRSASSGSSSLAYSYVSFEPDESETEDDDLGRRHPETPTTVFEDTQQVSPDDEGPTSMPNILVLGPADEITRNQQANARKQQQQQQQKRGGPAWSSNSSTLSGYSQGSGRSASSTSTIINPTSSAGPAQQEDPHLTCLKLLILKAAVNVGYQRPSPNSTAPGSQVAVSMKTGNGMGAPNQNHKLNPSSIGNGMANTTKNSTDASKNPSSTTTTTTTTTAPSTTQTTSPPSSLSRPISLATFVKSIPSNSFGSASWQTALLDAYKKLVASDPSFRHPSDSPQSTSTSPPDTTTPESSWSVGQGPIRRARAVDVARSVRWMVNSHAQYAWLKDLFRLVFGFHVDETETGRAGDVVIQG